MTWTGDAWRSIAPILSKIHEHPFVASLAAGTLPRETFFFYLGQDSLYLEDFAKVLTGLAEAAADPGDAALLRSFAGQAVEVELELHRSYLSDLPKAAISPACELYASYLYKQLFLGPWAAALAAVLPCFWIYQDVGDHIVQASRHQAGNPYQAWIDTYGGEEYAAAVQAAKDMADRAAGRADDDIRGQMTAAFVMASKMEWMFWDSAWRLEAWPL
jgi:thiaminase/transcriptional activator TenA